MIVITGLIDTFNGSQRVIVVQIGMTLHIGRVNVGGLGVHNIRGRVQVLIRVHPTLVP